MAPKQRRKPPASSPRSKAARRKQEYKDKCKIYNKNRRFRPEWKTEDRTWLIEAACGKKNFCLACSRKFRLSLTGIEEHEISKVHKQSMKTFKGFQQITTCLARGLSAAQEVLTLLSEL